jgi:hypothetical protein
MLPNRGGPDGRPSLRIHDPDRTEDILADGIQLREVWEKYLHPSLQNYGRSPKTLADIERHLARWEEFWRSEQRITDPLVTSLCKRHHLEQWQQSLKASDLSIRTVNKHLASIRQLLICAEKHRLVSNRARLEQMPHKKAAAKLYLTDTQLDRLWNAASDLNWPQGDIAPCDFWRAALILFRTYGFRTQELIAYDSKHSLKWNNICRDSAETPNPDGTAVNSLGWLWYVPIKQAWAKPDPLYLPLTRHSAAAIAKLVVGNSDDPLFRIPRSSRSFYNTWECWLNLADVKPKAIPGAKEQRKFEPKHLRKTCATYLDRHHKGLADAVCGWGDRTSETERSEVSSTHYIADELTIVDKLNSAPMPASFDAWL